MTSVERTIVGSPWVDYGPPDIARSAEWSLSSRRHLEMLIRCFE